MIQVQFLRESREAAVLGLNKRNIQNPGDKIDRIVDLDDRRKSLQLERDQLLHKINVASREIGDLYKAGKKETANEKRGEVNKWKEESENIEGQLNEVVENIQNLLLELPNIPHVSVPYGKGAEDNEVVRLEDRYLREKRESDRPHWDLMVDLDLVSLPLGVKITGAGFPLYKGKGARLQRALIQYFLDKAVEAGCTEIMPPHMVNMASAMGTGQLPDKEGQMYYVQKDDLYLIPTAEVPVTNIFRGDILPENELPVRFTAYTPCFRREAGSYGADVKGLNRVHQFDKVEMVVFTRPEDSYEMLDWMVNHATGLLDELKLPYRVLRLCGGDMGFTSALTYDLEVYSIAQERWLEVSSVSNFETFQSNRMKIRYRDEAGKIELLHTLNGSVLALPRIVAAILENYQIDGDIKIPEVLKPYTGFDRLK